MDYNSTEAAVAEQSDVVQAVEQVEAVHSDTDLTQTDSVAENPNKPAKRKEEWPPSAVNVLSKRKKEIHQLKQQIAELKSRAVPVPSEETWDKSFAELIEAKTMANVENRFNERQIEALEAQSSQAEQEFFYERVQEAGVKAAEYTKSIPDYQSTVQPYASIIDAAPPENLQLLFSATDPALATYGLAKLGILHDVLQMPSHLVTAYIAQGELYGRQMKLQTAAKPPQAFQQAAQQASNAPRPIEISGSSASVGTRDPSKMNKEDFSRWLNN